MGKYLELEPPSPSLGVHRFKREVRGVLLCGPEWEGGECEGGSVCLNRCIPRVLSGEMAQSRDVNGMGGGDAFQVDGTQGEGVLGGSSRTVGWVQGTRSCH